MPISLTKWNKNYSTSTKKSPNANLRMMKPKETEIRLRIKAFYWKMRLMNWIQSRKKSTIDLSRWDWILEQFKPRSMIWACMLIKSKTWKCKMIFQLRKIGILMLRSRTIMLNLNLVESFDFVFIHK